MPEHEHLRQVGAKANALGQPSRSLVMCQMQVAKLQVSIQDNSLMAQQLQARMATWALLLNFFTASAAASSCLFFLTAAPSG